MFKKFHHKTDINCNSLVQGERGSLIEGDEEEILKKFHSFLPLSCSSDVKGYVSANIVVIIKLQSKKY